MVLVVAEDLRTLDIKQLILSSEGYEENTIKELLMNIIEEGIENIKVAKQAEERERRDKMDFELQKLELQLEAQKSGAPHSNDIDISFNKGDKLKADDKSEIPSVSCYDCGKLSVTKPRCPNCKPIANRDSANFGNISLHSCSTPNQIAVLKLAINDIWRTACAANGAKVIIQEIQGRPNFEKNTCLLGNDEVKCLMPEQQRNKLSELLNLYGTVFEPGVTLLFLSNTVSAPEKILLVWCLPNFHYIEILVHFLHIFLSLILPQARDGSSSSPSFIGSSPPSSPSSMNIPVPPAFSIPP
ncbi:hypothetical protein TNIN_437121 [Trichonephila inaurata madagascariensis]|uniref:Uncharacterized protein n=1 Tax=Trichonephila inaurata madagascariensis TaxID=2747483 RepID=A0A8X6XKP0_9ARAC|nr:hypothetical protein TNIN_437121 [Trichonephila inaurata madagascariensis]